MVSGEVLSTLYLASDSEHDDAFQQAVGQVLPKYWEGTEPVLGKYQSSIRVM